MHIIQANSVNDALAAGINYILRYGEESDSRNGEVYVSPVPVTTLTVRPRWRVLSIPGRNENPFFHFVESLWMLAGRRDLAPLTAIVSRMQTFSDDEGRTQPGAYGYRWRRYFGHDQLEWAIKRLKNNPNDRRVVISMWDPDGDIDAVDRNTDDAPCNTHIYLGILEERLNLTVCCRSNDLLWGAHGANAVHFSVLLEYLAARIGCYVGRMWQVSNNYHMYINTMTEELLEACRGYNSKTYTDEDICRYRTLEVEPYRLFDNGKRPEDWDQDLLNWWNDGIEFIHSFFPNVATPIYTAHKLYKSKDIDAALEMIERCQASDWRLACKKWLLKRKG